MASSGKMSSPTTTSLDSSATSSGMILSSRNGLETRGGYLAIYRKNPTWPVASKCVTITFYTTLLKQLPKFNLLTLYRLWKYRLLPVRQNNHPCWKVRAELHKQPEVCGLCPPRSVCLRFPQTSVRHWGRVGHFPMVSKMTLPKFEKYTFYKYTAYFNFEEDFSNFHPGFLQESIWDGSTETIYSWEEEEGQICKLG